MTGKPYFPSIRDVPQSRLRRLLDALLNLLFPEDCLACSAPIARHQECGVCDACWDKALALRIVPPRCACCGLPLLNFEGAEEYLCGECMLRPPPFSGARAFGFYTGELGTIIKELKFGGRKKLGELLGPLLVSVFFESWGREDFDFIVPVPLHAKRRRQRGYNQAEVLARVLSRRLALPFHSFLKRIRPTLPQVGLSHSQRMENVRNAFRCVAPGAVEKKRILLVDDVMTTGATVASAAKALLEAGALRVSVLTVARAAKD